MRLTTSPPSCANVMKSGSLNLLETSGPHRACYGKPLPLMQMFYSRCHWAVVRLDSACLTAKQVMTTPAVPRLGITLHSAAREVAAKFGRFVLSRYKWMQKERARASFVFITYGRPRLSMEKAAVPEFYRQAMFELEFLSTVCFFFSFWNITK